jgi:hypothetical protein
MVPPVAIEVALPEALHAEVVETIVAGEGCWIVAAFFASLLRLDDVPIRDVYEHGLVLESVTSSVHVLETFEAEVIFAIGAVNLWALHRARGAKAAASCGEGGVGFARSLAAFMQGIEAGLTEGHEALIALQG